MSRYIHFINIPVRDNRQADLKYIYLCIYILRIVIMGVYKILIQSIMNSIKIDT